MSGASPTLGAIATAVPSHRVDQEQARAFARRRFATLPGLERLLPAFDHTGIAERQLVRPLSWYELDHGFAIKNAVWAEGALALAEQAAAAALSRWSGSRAELGAIVLVSSTGIATPSLDAALVQRLDLPRSIARVPLWGLGCAGGAAGLARAATMCRGLARPVLLVAVEICSATFVPADRSKANLIASALFGDGAAAAVVEPGGSGCALLGGHARLLDGTEDVMGWNVRDDGLQVRFARSIPAIVREVMPSFVEELAASVGENAAAIRHWALHPGGAKVLAAYAASLGLDDEALASARAVLHDHGNMSSPTALFVLERLVSTAPRTGQLGALIGLGPGFCADAAAFRW